MLARSVHVPLFCLLILAIHWLNQAAGTYGLMFDEAQYWFWAKHPAWGYYSKPPVIAWLMAASTTVFGDGAFGVKMLAPLITLATGCVLYATARRMEYDTRTASWVLLTYITLPFVTGNSMFFTTDVPLNFCWALALYGLISAWYANNPRYWLLVGVAVGIGLLSKYTMIAFVASAFLAMLCSPGRRKGLLSAWPWLAALIAFLILMPNLVWNAEHHFVTFAHTNDNVFSKTIEIYPADTAAFLGAQCGIMGPILLSALLWNALKARRADDSRYRLLHWFVWPLVAAGMVVSLLAGAQAHWISPVYLAGVLIVVPWLLQQRPQWLRVSLGLHLVVLMVFYLAPSLLPHLPLKQDPFARVFVWNELADVVRPLVQQHPDAVLMTNERKIAAALTYQLRDLRGWAEPVYKWQRENSPVHDHYDLLSAGKDFSDKPWLLLLRDTGQGASHAPARAKLLLRQTLQNYSFTLYFVPVGAG